MEGMTRKRNLPEERERKNNDSPRKNSFDTPPELGYKLRAREWPGMTSFSSAGHSSALVIYHYSNRKDCLHAALLSLFLFFCHHAVALPLGARVERASLPDAR